MAEETETLSQMAARLLKKIPWPRVYDIGKVLAVGKLGQYVGQHPQGVAGFDWNTILGAIAALGLGNVARYVIPDKKLYPILRTGDGTVTESGPETKGN